MESGNIKRGSRSI